jgi:chromosome condensin MukBEF MukE localization factor
MDTLPHLESIFHQLRRGYHVTPEDGDVYRALRDRFEEYQTLFDGLGLDLRKHPKDVFYLVANDNVQPSKQARKMGLFMLVLIEHVGETHESIVPSLFETVFRVEELPHLTKARYEGYMNAIDVHDASDLRTIVKTLRRFGFAAQADNGFTFRRAAYRFLDLCREASDFVEDRSASAATNP